MQPSAQHIAQDFLYVELANGARVRSEVIAAAKRAGIRPRTLQRAATALGIQTKRQGFGKGSTWQLPRPSEPEAAAPAADPPPKSAPAPTTPKSSAPKPRMVAPIYVGLDDPEWENPNIPIEALMAGVDLDEPTLTRPLKLRVRLPSLPRHAFFPWMKR